MRVSYNGQAVTQGARQNSADLNRLQAATLNQGRASASIAGQNRVLASSYTSLAGAVSAYVGAQGAIQFVKSIAGSEQLSTRLRNLTQSAEQYTEVQRYLEQSADRLNIRYTVLAEGMSGLLALEKAQVQTGRESRAILEGLSNAAKDLGASNNQVAQTLYGYKQAATQGTVQTTELLQVTEPLPGLLQAMDRAAGLAAGGFKKLTGDGKVTSQFFKETLIKALQEYEGAAEASSGTITAAANDFLTTYDIIAKKLQEPVNAAVVPMINAAATGLAALGDNVDVLGNLADGVVLLSAVLAGRFVASIGQATAAKIANQVATQRAAQAELTQASAALAVAKAEQQAAAAMFSSAVNLRTRAALSDQASAASLRLTAATQRYTAAQVQANIAARAGAGALALLGGPVGVAVTAALAIAYFASTSGDAKKPTDDLTDSIDKQIGKFKELNAIGRATSISELTRQEADARNTLIALQQKYREEEEKLQRTMSQRQGSNDFGGLNQALKDSAALDALKEQMAQAEAELNRIAELKSKLFTSTLPAVDTPIAETDTSAVDEKELTRLEKSLLTQEERIEASYVNRQVMLDQALAANQVSREKYDELSLRLEVQRDTELLELQRQTEETKRRRAREAEEERLRLLRESYENELAIIQGFEDRKALIQYEADRRLADARNQQQILQAQGFANRQEADEHARQEALLDATARRTGQMRGLLFSQAEWERKNELEKTDAVLSIGESGFKAMAGQSKKAFALYKTFAITKAVINTYEMATGAYNALASIPYVGPVLGAAAAAAAIAYGMAQVSAIKNQSYSAAYHGGRDYIPEEQTALLQRGERVVSPRQNVALTKAVDKINQGDAGGNVVHLNYNPLFQVQGTDENSMAKLAGFEQQLRERVINDLIYQLNNGTGAYYRAVRNVA
nr:tape measure protein [Bowmanella dokdonensis]